jgi:hypothetical protein
MPTRFAKYQLWVGRVCFVCMRYFPTSATPCTPDNEFGDAGATSLAEALNTNTALTNLQVAGACIFMCVWGCYSHLSLPWIRGTVCQIGSAGASALAGMLWRNRSLTRLDLDSTCTAAQRCHEGVCKRWRALCRVGNRFGCAGAASLGGALKRNSGLKTLQLKCRTSVQTLWLHYASRRRPRTAAEISAAGASSLALGLKDNSTMTALNVPGALRTPHTLCFAPSFRLISCAPDICVISNCCPRVRFA